MSAGLHTCDIVRRLTPSLPNMTSPNFTSTGNIGTPSADLEAWKGTLLGVEDELINAFASPAHTGTEQSPLLIDDDNSDTSSQVSRTPSSEIGPQSHTESIPNDNGAAAVTQKASLECSTFDLSIFPEHTACSVNSPSSDEIHAAMDYTGNGACVEPVQLLRLDPETVALLPPPRHTQLGALAIGDWSAIGSIANELLVGVTNR